MATIGQIVAKAAELKSAAEALADLASQRTAFLSEVAALNSRIIPQQALVQSLRAELVTLVNET